MVLKFFVPGRPMSTQTGSLVGTPAVDLQTPAGRIRIQKARMFPKRMGQEWTRTVKLHALKYRPAKMIEGPFRAECQYVFKPPAKEPTGGLPPIPLYSDCGNLTKALLDTMQGVLFENDKWVAEEVNRKRWGQPEGVQITLTSAPEFVV